MTYEVDWKFNEVVGPLERAATNLTEKLKKVIKIKRIFSEISKRLILERDLVALLLILLGV
jgi:hypothetical protein